jgi:hypothetical protein
MSVRVVLLGLAAVLCAACGGSGAEEGGPSFESTCPRGLTRPISVSSLIEIARAHGVSLERSPECSAYIGDVDAATNVVNAHGDEYDEITRREGHVICTLGDDPLAQRLGKVRRTKYPEDEETYFDVGNVQCAIYPERPDQVEQLRVALGAVARGPVERRDCPRAAPAPIGYEKLVRSARAHGIELQRDERCIAPGVVEQASNVLDYLPYGTGARAWDRIEAEQGRVTCMLAGVADPASTKVEEDKATVTTRLRYRNVECWVTPLPANNKRQVDAARALFEDLSGR